jgi:HEAT repeat protein
MARSADGRRSLEQRVASLRALDPTAPASLAKLRDAIQSTTGFVVAAAAHLVEEHRLEPLVSELVAAFGRLCDEPTKRDPGCRGKVAIARALHSLDHWDDRVFVAGVTYVQREGWNAEDIAGELRGTCGLAHAHFARPDALDVLAGLLADGDRTARLAAAQALGDAGRPDATALLRFKLLSGDDEPQVLSACIESLFGLARDASYDFVVRVLAAHDERAEVAALAIAGARFADAFDALTGWCIGATAEQRHRIGFLALALLRTDAANGYLLDAIRGHGPADAVAAARALATFKDDAAIARQVEAAAQHQKLPITRREIAALFA